MPRLTSREIVRRSILFQGIPRLPRDFPKPYGTDFYWVNMTPSPDDRPSRGVDEWGCVWRNMGTTNLGEVKDYPLKEWSDFAHLKIPDIEDPARWKKLVNMRKRAGNKFILASIVSIYERVHFLRGLENTWVDIKENRSELERLLDLLVEMNLYAIKRYAELDADGVILADDWGLQNRLMIKPVDWRALWKPRYARIFAAAQEQGLLTFMHSCGYITDILDDLVEVGLHVIHMDQQENMGVEYLGNRFAGRLTFFCPVDIQKTMVYGSLDDIRAYCRRLVIVLGRLQGGFIPRWYGDPIGAGHRQEAIDAMCQEFLRIG
jgi:uroporphyrinogen decarboxylase